jgi:hypothetical protein
MTIQWLVAQLPGGGGAATDGRVTRRTKDDEADVCIVQRPLRVPGAARPDICSVALWGWMFGGGAPGGAPNLPVSPALNPLREDQHVASSLCYNISRFPIR